jgi:hypothetical protein
VKQGGLLRDAEDISQALRGVQHRHVRLLTDGGKVLRTSSGWQHKRGTRTRQARWQPLSPVGRMAEFLVLYYLELQCGPSLVNSTNGRADCGITPVHISDLGSNNHKWWTSTGLSHKRGPKSKCRTSLARKAVQIAGDMSKDRNIYLK